uniref:exodeoxyribonuclease VII large subunit n=1 Tax=Undibacterium luofuense TaxID=2828733 RepID=UPI0030ED8073
MNTESPVLNRAAMPSVMSVSALNNAVAQMLERQIPLLWVSGEISNFTRAASGHWYFTLKDAGAQVRAVMFRGRAMYAEFQPREGDKVEVRATVGLYAPRGDYQLTVEAIRRAGVGHLYESFLRIKATLEAEGLLAAERKRPLPPFVKRIGLITSPQAAALRDDEWVFSGNSFTDIVWMGADGKVRVGEVDAASRDNLWAVGFANPRTKDSFVALFLEHSAEGIPELKHNGSPTLFYRTH